MAIGHLLRIVMAFILVPVISRILGAEDFGKYNLATTIMFFAVLMDDFGLNMWLTREISKRREEAQRYFSYAAGLKVALILAAVLFVAVLVQVSPYDRLTVQTIWIFTLYAVLISFRDLMVAVFRAHEEMIWETIVLGVERTLITALGIIVLLSGGRLVALSWIFVLAALISIVISFVLTLRFVRPAVAMDVKVFWAFFRGAWVFGISMFLTTIYTRIDMMMLSVMKEPAVWGWYAAAHKLLDFTNVVPSILMIATFPTLARLSASSQQELSLLFTRGFKYLFVLGLPIIPGVFLLSDSMVRVYYGDQFLPAITTLQVFGLTAAILFLNIYAAGLFGATNHQSKLVLIQTLGLLLNAAANYLLIPKYAHFGAALATVITEGIVLAITLYITFTRIVKLTDRRFFADAILACTVMAVMVYFLRQHNIWLVVLLGIGCYFGVLFWRKTITIQELLSFRRRDSAPVIPGQATMEGDL